MPVFLRQNLKYVLSVLLGLIGPSLAHSAPLYLWHNQQGFVEAGDCVEVQVPKIPFGVSRYYSDKGEEKSCESVRKQPVSRNQSAQGVGPGEKVYEIPNYSLVKTVGTAKFNYQQIEVLGVSRRHESQCADPVVDRHHGHPEYGNSPDARGELFLYQLSVEPLRDYVFEIHGSTYGEPLSKEKGRQNAFWQVATSGDNYLIASCGDDDYILFDVYSANEEETEPIATVGIGTHTSIFSEISGYRASEFTRAFREDRKKNQDQTTEGPTYHMASGSPQAGRNDVNPSGGSASSNHTSSSNTSNSNTSGSNTSDSNAPSSDTSGSGSSNSDSSSSSSSERQQSDAGSTGNSSAGAESEETKDTESELTEAELTAIYEEEEAAIRELQEIAEFSEGNFEHIVCTGSTPLNVRDKNDEVLFQAEQFEAIKPYQGWANEASERRSFIGGTEYTFKQVQFTNRKGALGWVATQFVKLRSECKDYQDTLEKEENIVCIDDGIVNVRDAGINNHEDDSKNIIFQAEQYENIALREDWKQAQRRVTIGKEELNYVPVFFTDKRRGGWIADKYVSTRESCQGYDPRKDPGSLESVGEDIWSWIYPLEQRSWHSYRQSPAAFNSSRGARKHAAADLYRSVGDKIHAVAPGKVIRVSSFYCGVSEITVEHAGGRVVRYGETLFNYPSGISAGKKVKAGDHIASVGKLTCYHQPMLHFELYRGKGKNTESLTQRARRPYQRRSDLEDPTKYIQHWEKKRFGKSH